MKHCDFKTNEKYTFFDLCVENDLRIEVEHRIGEKIEITQGYITGYHPEINMFSMKGNGGYDITIPIQNVECITLIDKL
ncbi:hypothetical protein QRY07_11935 [Bacillus cereus]|uniref:hypothetical protein n=1 Tax=Bacillus cereus TaxID=1396 RepID=UPI0025704F13|nr:hypothetical protein [Bacillus cereus]WJE22399.1 hypothetical protein QRY07_11935 [Bacillus cereus]